MYYILYTFNFITVSLLNIYTNAQFADILRPNQHYNDADTDFLLIIFI